MGVKAIKCILIYCIKKILLKIPLPVNYKRTIKQIIRDLVHIKERKNLQLSNMGISLLPNWVCLHYAGLTFLNSL